MRTFTKSAAVLFALLFLSAPLLLASAYEGSIGKNFGFDLFGERFGFSEIGLVGGSAAPEHLFTIIWFAGHGFETERTVNELALWLLVILGVPAILLSIWITRKKRELKESAEP